MVSSFLLVRVTGGGDINNPFIDIVASDSGIDCSVLKSVSHEWVQLQPQYIRILSPGHLKVQGITDQLIYAFCLSGAPEYPDEVLTLRPAECADFEWCRQALTEAYQYSLLAVPALKDRLYSVDGEELSDYISAGDAYIIFEDEIRVGLIICEKGEVAFLGATGFLKKLSCLPFADVLWLPGLSVCLVTILPTLAGK